MKNIKLKMIQSITVQLAKIYSIKEGKNCMEYRIGCFPTNERSLKKILQNH